MSNANARRNSAPVDRFVIRRIFEYSVSFKFSPTIRDFTFGIIRE